MPEQDARRRIADLKHRIAFQILACTFEIRTDSVELVESLRYLVQQAEQDYPVSQHHTYAVYRDDDRIAIAENMEPCDFELANASILENLFKRVHNKAFEALPNHVRIHAASGFLGDRFFIFSGDKYAGKSTLTLKLLHEGFDMLGDELVMLNHEEAVTFPRKMYVRRSCLDLLPEFRALSESLPFVSNATEPHMIAFDPLDVGKRWDIRPSPLGVVIYIESNHGGRSRLVRCGKLDMVQKIILQCTPPIAPSNEWVGAVTAAVNRADTFVLEFGDLESAVKALRRAIETTAAAS